MTTLADEMRQCLSEMQAASDKMKKLLDTPGVVWPETSKGAVLNTVMIDGVAYYVVEGEGCDECDLDAINCHNLSRPRCFAQNRLDNKNVVFKKV